MSELHDDPEICGARHPHEPARCQLAPGPNAVVEIPAEIPATATEDEVFDALSVPPQQVQVHVHKALSRQGETIRWEDAPKPVDENTDGPAEPHVLVDLLSLVGVTVTEDDVAGWHPAQRNEAQTWAILTHLSASDNDVRVPAKPDFLHDPKPSD